jgi:hypothetical protein
LCYAAIVHVIGMSKPANTGLRGGVFNGLPLKKIAALKTVDVTPGVGANHIPRLGPTIDRI